MISPPRLAQGHADRAAHRLSRLHRHLSERAAELVLVRDERSPSDAGTLGLERGVAQEQRHPRPPLALHEIRGITHTLRLSPHTRVRHFTLPGPGFSVRGGAGVTSARNTVPHLRQTWSAELRRNSVSALWQHGQWGLVSSLPKGVCM